MGRGLPPAPNPQLPLFPDEIWDLVIHNLDGDPRTLAAVRMVSRRFYRLVRLSGFLKRVVLRDSKKSLLSLDCVAKRAGYKSYVKDLEFDVKQPDQEDLDKCRHMRSRHDTAPRVIDLGKAMHLLLYHDGSERLFRGLEKLTIRFPVAYRHKVQGGSSDALTKYEATDIFQKYRYYSSMYLKMYMKLFLRGAPYDEYVPSPETARCSYDKGPTLNTMELINISPHQSSDLLSEEICFRSVENLRLQLCLGQIYHDGQGIRDPSHLEVYFHHFENLFIDILQHSFPSINTLHLSAWFDQGRYYFFRNSLDMAIDLFRLCSSRDPQVTHLTVENAAIYASALPGTLKSLRLKNCILVYGTWTDTLKNQFGKVLRKGFELCIESADGEEGHPSAFMCAKREFSGNDYEDSIVLIRSRISEPEEWQESVVAHEDEAVEAYWDLKRRLTVVL